MRGGGKGRWVEAAIDTMLQSNGASRRSQGRTRRGSVPSVMCRSHMAYLCLHRQARAWSLGSRRCGAWAARRPWPQAAALPSRPRAAGTAVPVLRRHGATACTDVTGFGLLGHLAEMARASKAGPAAPLVDPALPIVLGVGLCHFRIILIHVKTCLVEGYGQPQGGP